MDLSTGRVTLVEEARELLAGMENALLELEKEGQSDEQVNALFRAAHTIKGAAGLFGLTLIEKFTQRLENILDLVREGARKLTPELLALLLRCRDYIAQLVDAIDARQEDRDPAPELRSELLEALAGYEETKRLAPLVVTNLEAESAQALFHLSIRYAPQALNWGTCPASYLDHLQTLGELVYVCTTKEALPEIAHFDPKTLYLGFEVGLRGNVDASQIEGAFALIHEQVTLSILSARSPIERFADLIRSLPGCREQLFEHWVDLGLVSEVALRESLTRPDPAPRQPGQAGRSGDPPSAATPAAARPRNGPTEQRNVKVDAGRLDHLINLVGELVIASEGARTTAASPKSQRSDVVESLGRVLQLVESIRDRALSMRMTPIGDVFQRFPRVVRDVSKELGKKIELDISGAEAELDKSIVERLADPMLHIVRNAIDHGIEPVAEREAAGKSPVGQLRLHAHHEAGCIVVEVGDDGRGLDPERLRRKAIERGLVDASAPLTTQDCYKLIFAPGFSTAQQVTSLSGRGVGMDVVKRNVDALRGDIEIESELGAGSIFRMRLPLTLAIIDGFQVVVAGTTFVIPLELVVECLDMDHAESERHLVNLRDEPLPYLRLRDVFELSGERSPRESLVVVSFGQQRLGIVVDALLGNSQAVIKPLGPIFRGLPAVSSSTILGDGTVALILDVPALINAANPKVTNRTFNKLEPASAAESAQ